MAPFFASGNRIKLLDVSDIRLEPAKRDVASLICSPESLIIFDSVLLVVLIETLSIMIIICNTERIVRIGIMTEFADTPPTSFGDFGVPIVRPFLKYELHDCT